MQTTYTTQGVKGGGNPEVGGLAQYSLQSNYTMPSIATNIKVTDYSRNKQKLPEEIKLILIFPLFISLLISIHGR